MVAVEVDLESFVHFEAFRYAHWSMKSPIKSSFCGAGRPLSSHAFAYNEQIAEQKPLRACHLLVEEMNVLLVFHSLSGGVLPGLAITGGLYIAKKLLVLLLMK